MNKRQYIEYLVATPNNYTCTNLANHLEGEQTVSHDAISDYLQREKRTPRRLWEVVAPLLHDSPDAYLIVDDGVQDKRYSHKIELVKLQYSGVEGGLLRDFLMAELRRPTIRACEGARAKVLKKKNPLSKSNAERGQSGKRLYSSSMAAALTIGTSAPC